MAQLQIHAGIKDTIVKASYFHINKSDITKNVIFFVTVKSISPLTVTKLRSDTPFDTQCSTTEPRENNISAL